MEASGPPVLRVEGLVAGYTRELNILNGVDLDLYDREIVCILGPNGAGKSTLLKAVCGLLGIRQGQVLLDGRDVAGLRPNVLARLGLGYVPQIGNVFPRLSVEENLEVGGGIRCPDVHHRIKEMYALFPRLEERRMSDAGWLSGGERQMLAVARALMADPRVLLLDEPSAGLSPKSAREVFDRIAMVNAQGVSILLVEQNARLALSLAHRGYVLDEGRNRYEGTGPALLADDRVVELYLGQAAREGAEAATATAAPAISAPVDGPAPRP